jgi:hypothetical protein
MLTLNHKIRRSAHVGLIPLLLEIGVDLLAWAHGGPLVSASPCNVLVHYSSLYILALAAVLARLQSDIDLQTN